MDSKVAQLDSRLDSLFAKFKQERGTNYSDEAIVLEREALELYPPDRPERSFPLNWLAGNLWERYRQLGTVMNLDES
ncbi:hypothetical protein J3R82DRAFT_2014 [Butyriboletus roseoflavus]|nr:hypothetical protein J3R82DRAFT_2014 [Butyriboletus roseoflavus]